MKKLTIFFVASLFCIAAFAQQTARLQVIHNSPSPTVDIWVNGAKLLADFKYRTASPFIDAPANINLKIEVKAPNSTAATAALATFNATLEAAKTYIAIATGIVGDAKTPFTLKVVENALEKSRGTTKTALAVYHGSTDAPAVDVYARNVAKIVDGAAYNDATAYFEVPNAKYILDVTAKGSTAAVASFNADLSGLGGGAAIVIASGFLAPKTGEPAFGLFAVLPNGTVVALPPFTTSAAEINTQIKSFSIFPSLANTFVNVNYTLEKETPLQIIVSDNTGRLVFSSGVVSKNTGDYNEILEVGNWAKGTYFIQLQTNKGVITQKMMKVE